MPSTEQKKSFIDKFPRILRVALCGYKGRVGRVHWWIWHIIMIAGTIVISSTYMRDHLPAGLLLSMFAILGILKMGATFGRMHDLGHSGWLLIGWWLLLSILNHLEIFPEPYWALIASLLIWVYLGFFPPVDENKWGKNPHQPPSAE